MAKRLFFLHIPKTAGTSLRSYLLDQYPKELVFPKVGWSDISVNELDSLQLNHLVMGHFDTRILPFINEESICATFLREPIARTVSAIKHAQADPNFRVSGLEINGRGLKEIIRDPDVMRFFKNTQTGLFSVSFSKDDLYEYFAVKNDSPKYGDLYADIEEAKKNLKAFDFVGVTEKFDQGLLQLASLCQFYPPMASPLLNQRLTSDKDVLDDSDIDLLKSYNESDMELYQYALEINGNYPQLNRKEVLRDFFMPLSPIVSQHEFSLVPPFKGWGFYGIEGNAGNNGYRWSGPKTQAGLSIKLMPNKTYKITINYYLSGIHAANVEIHLNEKAVKHETSNNNGSCQAIILYQATDEFDGVVEINFIADKVVSPKEIDINSMDYRSLGFVLSNMTIEEADSSLS